MECLSRTTTCLEWAARLAAPALFAATGIALALAATIAGHLPLAAALAAGALLACIAAALGAKRAIRRIRGGPDTPPGESF